MIKSLPLTKWFSGIVLLLVFAINGQAQTTYTWNSTTGGVISTSTNWTPERTTPAATDILVFSDGNTYNVTGVATQTIGQLLVSNGTKVTLQASAATQTLTIAGGTGTDLDVASGCELNINTANALTIALSTGATGSVSGSMTFAAGAHRLIPADASGVTFNNGASFTEGTSFSGNPFGTSTTAVANSVIFASGSTFIFIAGSNPFALTAPASAVIFQTGSLYKQKSTGTPSVSNRIFANFEYDNAGTLSVSGSTPFTMDNLTVTSGTLNVNMTGTGSGANIKGNITVVAGATLTFSPSAAGNVTFSGSSAQTITGTVTANANATIVLNQDLVIAGSLTDNGNLNLGTKTISGAGSLTIASAGTITTANAYGLDRTQNITVTTLTNNAASYAYNGSVAQVTGAALPSTVTNLTINNTSTDGVSLTSDENISGALTCTAGLLKLGSKNLVVVSGKNITASYNSYVVTDGTGTLTHTLAASTNPVYGFGTTSGYAPVVCMVSAAGSGNVVAGSVKAAITHAPLHPNKVVQQEWIFNETVTGTDAGTVSFGWNNTTAAGSEFDVSKPVVFASWSGTAYNMDNVTPVAGSNGMYTITVDLPTNIPNTPLLIGNKSAFLPDAPALAADATDNTVDHDITITFTDDATWRSAVTAVSVNGTALTATTDYTLEAGILTLKPSGGNTLLTTSGTKTVTVTATGYNDATVSQLINAGALNMSKSYYEVFNPLTAGLTTTIKLYAKDVYGNMITGYVFKANITVTDAVATTDESYMVNGTALTSSATGILLPATVNGFSSFDISIPAVVDGGDGIALHLFLNDGTTNFGSASYSAPLIPTVSISVDNPAALVEEQMGRFQMYVTLLNDTFIDNILSKSNFTLNNAPAGMSIEDVTYSSVTSATLTIYYDSTDFDTNITNFNITVAGAELTSGTTLTSNSLTLYAVVETAPVVTTNAAVTTLGMFSATWGGEATADGGEAITEKGICWSKAANPTIADSKTTEGAGTGTITGSMTGLLQGTKYYVCAYATNSVGTTYGDVYSFTTTASYEDFVNFPETSTSYKDGSFTGRDGSTWSYVKCAGTSTTQITTPSPVLAKNAILAYVTSGTIPNGVSTLTFKYVQAFTTSVNLDVFVNSTKVANITTVSESAMATVHTVTIPVYISGDVVLKFIQNSSTSGQVTIDDISWTPYVSDGNTVTVPRFSPLPCASIGSQSVTVTSETADASIFYTTDGTEPTSASTPYTGAINLTTTTTVKAIATKAGMTDSPVMSGTYNVEAITDVATISDLRAGTVGSLYRLTGEGIVTFVNSTQKFIQDANAGIVIYDAGGIITTTVNQYDGIKNITGRLYSYSGVLELLPVTGYSTVTVSSTGNSVTPITLSVTDFNAAPSTYESRLIKITGLTFADANGTVKFASTATNYNVSDGTNTTVFRTAFTTADYVGTVIPYKADIVGLGMQYNGTAQFAARNLADFTIYSSAKAITGFAFNGLTPAVTGTINETSKTITATVPAGTNRTALVPTITVSANATVSPLSGVATDFTSAVTYTVTAQDGTTQAYTVTVSVASGIDTETEAKVKVGPVPATTELKLLNVEPVIQIDIYNVAGLKISTSKHDSEDSITVPLNGYAPGIYFIKFTTADGTFIKRFIKQ
jgi:hypothetical protein